MFNRTEPQEETKKPESIELEYINIKLPCECSKDSKYRFACKHGVKWFTNNMLVSKILKK
jgi:hypothetical protein